MRLNYVGLFFFKDLAHMLGFKTIRAQTTCQNANDHHKSMQIIEIALLGCSDELLHQYCVFCVEENKTPTVDDFFLWSTTSVENENFLFLSEICFTYLLSIYLFRAAVRRNISELILACRMKFANLFYITNMTNYMELNLRDLLIRLAMPPDVKSFVESYESFSMSDHPSKGEGGDFILEARNRRTKMWLPSGLPSEDNWLRVCRNQDRLEKV